MRRGLLNERFLVSRCPPARLVALAALIAVASGPVAGRTGIVAGGIIAGRVQLSSGAAAKAAERYVGSGGDTREIARVPVIVFVEGAVAGSGVARAAATPQVTQRNQEFDPPLLVVPVGASVRFPNGDPEFHNVFSYSRAKRFDLGRYRQGESKTVVFDRAGYVKVLCEVHKWMRAAIVVVENPYHTIVSETGQFTIADIPPGRYRVTIEHFDRRTQVDNVDVREGATTELNLRL